MWTSILIAFWFFIPAGVANTAAVFASKLPVLRRFSYPMDFKKSINGVRIFGDHKTIRGLVVGIAVAILLTAIEINIYNNSSWLKENLTINYSEINPLIFGFLSGFGALMGDAVKSFFKRRVGVKPGDSWFPFDQIDYIVGGILATMIYVRLNFIDYLFLLLIWFILHPLSTFVGFLLKLKDKPI